MKTTGDNLRFAPPGPGSYLFCYVLLLGLLGVTLVVAYTPLGFANTLLAIAIALVKTTLVLWFFMHLKVTQKLVLVILLAAAGTFVWQIVLVLLDLFTR